MRRWKEKERLGPILALVRSLYLSVSGSGSGSGHSLQYVLVTSNELFLTSALDDNNVTGRGGESRGV